MNKHKEASNFFIEMTKQGFTFTKSGDSWVKVDPVPTDIKQIMLIGQFGNELAVILDDISEQEKQLGE